MVEHRTIEREALGRIASLGDLYDARRDQFNEFNIFKTSIPQDAISSIDNRSTDFDYTMSDSMEEKFKKMDIRGEISVSILGGLVKGTGSASYLSDKKDSARSVRCSLYYKCKTKTERLNIFHEKLAEVVATSALRILAATHVVAGITWGANATITFDYANTEKLDKQVVEGAFRAHVERIDVAVNGSANANFTDCTTSKNLNFKIHTFADITAPDEKIPSTPEEALVFLRKMPTHVKEANNGKGKPLSYKLVPISIVQKCFNMECMVDHVLVSLDEHALIDFIRLFDELSEAKQRLYDLWLDMRSHTFCICEGDFRKVKDAKEGLEKAEAMLRSKFAKTLVAVRYGEAGSDKLDKLGSEHISGQYSAKEVNLLVDSFSEVMRKISFADFLMKNGVTYIGRGELFECEMRKNMKGTVYILFFGSEDMNSKDWRTYQNFFINLIDPEKPDETFLAVDLDLRKDIADKEEVGGGIRICKYRNARYISYDLLADNNLLGPPFQRKLPTRVRGITSSNTELYVVTYQSPDIEVYNIEFDRLDHRRKIKVEGLVNGFDIVAHANVLYVSEYDDKLIHRIQLSDDTFSHWSVNGRRLTMSINKRGNILVSCWYPNKIIEYTPIGSCVREIKVNAIDETIAGLQHAIQLDDYRFLICHATTTHHRVCIIDNKGRMMKSYGGEKGSGIGQMNLPFYLAIDRNGFIFVADFNNNRIIQLNASLEFIGEFISASVGLVKPNRLHLHDQTSNRLFIGEADDRSFAIFDSCEVIL